MNARTRGICCHEAGHAVANILLSAIKIDMVIGDMAACTTEHKAVLSTPVLAASESTPKVGVTITSHAGWRCPNPTCDGIEQDGYGCYYAPGCECCDKRLIDHIAVFYCGHEAEQQLMGYLHLAPGNEGDVKNGEYVLTNHGDSDRNRIRAAAKARAERWMREEKKAVLALRDALVAAGGVLEGEEAERIIRANLSPAALQAQKPTADFRPMPPATSERDAEIAQEYAAALGMG